MIPAVVSVLPSLAKPAPRKVIMSTEYGQMGDKDLLALQILNPAELRRAGFTPVALPCFLEDNVPYCVKTWRLKTYCNGTPDMQAIIGAKQKVILEMKRLQLTHVYYVAFNPYPIYMHDWQKLHSAVVRGCRLKPWDHTLRILPPRSYDARTA